VKEGDHVHAYRLAQRAIADLKSAVIIELSRMDTGSGLSNAEVGRLLGIYAGHKGHLGHIPRTLLAIMEADGTVQQDKASKKWRLVSRAGEKN
jgi:hypothetical protein